MSIRNLKALFYPRSIAVIGASEKPTSLGTMVVRNLLDCHFHGPILPVNPRYRSVTGVLCYRSVADLPVPADLAVLCTPPATIPGLIAELGARQTRAAVIMAVPPAGEEDESFRQSILDAARPSGMRILGPGSTGIQVPSIGLNASWVTAPARPGKVAFISQSGSLIAWVLEWAAEHGVGFSHVVSAGEAADADIGDLLDFLATDGKTRAVVLYMRAISDSRKFLSAARAIARIKPLLVVKSDEVGPEDEPRRDPLAIPLWNDAVYDAAFRRAGMVRVRDMAQLFDAVETLTHGKKLRGERLAILCNGRGPGQMAADTLIEGGGRLAEVSAATRATLAPGEVMREGAGNGRAQPFDIGRDATPQRYHDAIDTLLADPMVDALLVMHVPTAMANVDDIATVVRDSARKSSTNMLACFLGSGEGRGACHASLTQANVAVYHTPEEAARAFLHLVQYRRNQASLLQIPNSGGADQAGGHQPARARALIKRVLSDGRRIMDEAGSLELLSCYGFTGLPTRPATTIKQAQDAAEAIGYPVSLRLASRSVLNRYDLGAMSRDIASDPALRAAAADIVVRFSRHYPGEAFPGFVVQAMYRQPSAERLTMGIANHPVFGRVVRLGTGRDRDSGMSDVIGLPPLNSALARELLVQGRTRRLLPPGNADGDDRLVAALVALSDLTVDLPEVASLEISPLLLGGGALVPIDARIGLADDGDSGRHLAIRPYPRELEGRVTLADGRAAVIRPIRPEDEPAYRALLSRMNSRDLYLRYCSRFSDEAGQRLSDTMLAKLVHIDYDREMTLAAMFPDLGGETAILGIVDAITSADRSEAEFSILVRSDLQGSGLGRILTEAIIDYCRQRKIATLYGLVLRENRGMLGLAAKLGFIEYEIDDDEDMVRIQYSFPRS